MLWYYFSLFFSFRAFAMTNTSPMRILKRVYFFMKFIVVVWRDRIGWRRKSTQIHATMVKNRWEISLFFFRTIFFSLFFLLYFIFFLPFLLFCRINTLLIFSFSTRGKIKSKLQVVKSPLKVATISAAAVFFSFPFLLNIKDNMKCTQKA